MRGCRTGCLPRKLTEKGICLCMPGPRQLFMLCRMVMQAGPDLRANLGLPGPAGFFTALFVLSRIFNWVYIIKTDGRASGMLGASSWKPGGRAVLTMVIWNREERGRGTGSRALGLAVRELSRRGLCREFLVEVKEDNERGIRFWNRNGFKETGRGNGTVLLCR